MNVAACSTKSARGVFFTVNNGPVHRIPSMRIAEIERRKAGHQSPMVSESAIAWRSKYILEHTT